VSALRLRTPAKLNLVLRVVGRRADGYHLLETLFHAIDLQDELRAERAPALSLQVTAADARDLVPAGDDNLVVRAARAFSAQAGLAPGFRLALHKRIPNGAGLGGGSSDAAATLRLCNELCGRPLADPALHALARGLGADVAFFLAGGSQWGHGIGDELTPAPAIAEGCFVLLVPPFGCATAAVYKNLERDWNALPAIARVPDVRDRLHEDSVLRFRFENDLESAAEQVRPELRQIKGRARAMLAGAGVAGTGPVCMTGSGSTLFVPVGAASAAPVADALAPLQALGVRVLVTRSLPDLPAPVAVEQCG
jgi:4-diphosphocytidyl-2-C-methyl-D-erythritol kinase